MGFSLNEMDAMPVPTKRWARVEYERLVDRAVFQPGERVELVGGQLVVREPQGSPHAVAAGLAEDALRAAFGPGWGGRGQMPGALDDESEPPPTGPAVPGASATTWPVIPPGPSSSSRWLRRAWLSTGSTRAASTLGHMCPITGS